MSKQYIMFTCIGQPTISTKCTTKWPDNILCTIPIGGMVGENFHNLMVMVGDENDIIKWVNFNSDKVSIITKDEADILGQHIIIPGSERVEVNTPKEGKETVYVAGEFNVENSNNLWSIKEVRDMVVEENINEMNFE